jgi:hypothetical protein
MELESPLFVRRFHVPVETANLPPGRLLTGQNLPQRALRASAQGGRRRRQKPTNPLIRPQDRAATANR